MSWLREWEDEDERRDLKRSEALARGSRSVHEGVKPSGCVPADLKAANDRRDRLLANSVDRLVELGAVRKGMSGAFSHALREKAFLAGIEPCELDSSRQDAAGSIRRGGVATLAPSDSRDLMVLAEVVAGRVEVM